MAKHPGSIQRREKLAGLALIAAAALALAAANSGLAHSYHAMLHTPLGPALPRAGVLDLHGWIADGLMAIFFLLIGLEVRREWYSGLLATPAERRLPIVAAVAGMAVPALIYLIVTGFEPALIRGWAIPSATDIAFAIGVLALLGQRAAPTVKLLLVTIAVVDDVGAVIIIALVYTASLDSTAIGAALVIAGAMAGINMLGVRKLWPYVIGFGALWVAVLASGIHPTVAGVIAALTIPLGRGEQRSPLKRLEHAIHPLVMFGVMPLFGFASAGVELGGSLAAIAEPLPLAVLAGLFVGKQIGVFGAIWLAVKAGLSEQPPRTRWLQLYGASLLCGIGFTMSLFIGELAFPNAPDAAEGAKLGVLAGSILSAIGGWAVLRFARPTEALEKDLAEAEEIFAEDEGPAR